MLGNKSKCLILILLVTLAFIGCSKGKDKEKSTVAKPALLVEVDKATQADIVEGVDVTGALSAKFQSDVRAEFAGAITDVYVPEWVHVQKGTPLARQDTNELDLMLHRGEAALDVAKANALQAVAGRNRAEREYERFLKMKDAGLVTQQMLDDITTEKEAANARLAAAEAGVKAAERELLQGRAHIAKGIIRSPMNGIVSLRNVNPGDLVGDMGGTKVLFKVVDPSILDLTVTAPSKEMAVIRVGQPLPFSTDAAPGKIFSGKVKVINPTVSETDRSIKVIAEVENSSGELKPGLFAKGRIITGTRKGILQVPRIALLSWDVVKKQADVFVINGDVVARKTIRTGVVLTDFVEVVSGLTLGDQVVTRGGFNLKDKDRVRVIQSSGR
jgi:membrane fusion protein, multidrug efflux system